MNVLHKVVELATEQLNCLLHNLISSRDPLGNLAALVLNVRADLGKHQG